VCRSVEQPGTRRRRPLQLGRRARLVPHSRLLGRPARHHPRTRRRRLLPLRRSAAGLNINRYDVAPAILSRHCATSESRRRCACRVADAATLSREQARPLHRFCRFTILLRKRSSKMMKLFTDRTLSFCKTTTRTTTV